MNPRHSISFGGYLLDLRDERLWRGQEAIDLTPKAFTLLGVLASQAGHLVTKDELFRSVWPRSVVTDATLTQCIRELRQALQDDARAPRYIETVHGRGYRFIAALERGHPASLLQSAAGASVVGRDAELSMMDQWLQRMLAGERQVVLVNGEPGIGKTTLVQAFLARHAQRGLGVALGRCIEQFGHVEPYLPVLEALERLASVLEAKVLRATLRQYAPSWLAQLPSLTEPEEREQLQHQLAGTTRDRMLREIAHAVEVLSSDRPIVLWLEDLHWSDYSTLDLLSCLARRSERAQLLVVATYRPLEVLARQHPLRDVRQELSLHGLCREVALNPLGVEAVQDYLRERLGDSERLADAARFLHARTEGNPLFMSAVLDDLTRRGLLRRAGQRWELDVTRDASGSGVPENLRQLIERQFGRLDDEDRRLLEAGSVAGARFSVAALAAADGTQPAAIEERCAALASISGFIQPTMEAPGYRFVHAFHREVVYERLGDARRRQLHLALGRWQERASGDRAPAIAAELAMHFERGGERERALVHLRTAVAHALRQSAHVEATGLIQRGLTLVEALDDGVPSRTEHALALQLGLGAALLAVKGFAAPEVGEAYGRARGMLAHMTHSPDLMLALGGLITFYLQRGELHTAHEIAHQCIERASDPVCHLITQHSLGTVLYCQGEFTSARQHLERALTVYPSVARDEYLFFGRDPGVVSLSYLAGALWHLGFFEQAWQRMDEALRLADRVEQPMSMVVALLFAASLEALRYDCSSGMRHAQRALAIAAEQRYPFFIATATILRGHFLTCTADVREGIEEMQRGLAARRATGAIVLQPFYAALLAEAYAQLGDRDAALEVLADAFAQVAQTGERGYEAELHRLKGVVLARSPCESDAAGAEASLVQARELARGQQTRGWELRAALDLGRLLQRQRRHAEGRCMLEETLHGLSEGFDSPDVREGQRLLAALQAGSLTR